MRALTVIIIFRPEIKGGIQAKFVGRQASTKSVSAKLLD